MKLTNEQLARKIYEETGPAGNIRKVSNCMTRLRLQLAEKDGAMLERLKSLEGVFGIHDSGEELQIILGPGKATIIAREQRAMDGERRAIML